MKKYIYLPALFIFMVIGNTFSQTVYVNQTGNTYHTNKCKLYTKNFEAVPLWKAKGPYEKKPCGKCNPPVNETKATPKKKSAPKPALKK